MYLRKYKEVNIASASNKIPILHLKVRIDMSKLFKNDGLYSFSVVKKQEMYIKLSVVHFF